MTDVVFSAELWDETCQGEIIVETKKRQSFGHVTQKGK
jgi:hypothetical protein